MTLDQIGYRGFLGDVEHASEGILSLISKGKSFLVICHNDADGLSSGAIASAMLLREGAGFVTRSVKSIDEAVAFLKMLPGEVIPILTDIGGGYLGEVSEAVRDRPVFIFDHHEPMGSPGNNVLHVNPHLHGVNGAMEISGAGVVYLIARSLNEENVKLSPIAVVGALGDLQDRSDKRGLHGLNDLIVRDAVDKGLMNVEEDLLFYGRSHKPLHIALASTMNPFIVGISGNEAQAYSLLTGIGIKVKDDDRWRVLADLTEDEKKLLYNGIMKYLASLGLPPSMAKELVGKVYELTKEEPWTYLRDAREFASLLNACGKTGRDWIGIAIAMGCRGSLLEEAQMILEEYRRKMAEAMTYAMREENRQELKHIVVIDGGDVIDDLMISSVASMLSSIGIHGEERILLALAHSEDSIKVSARAPKSLIDRGINLGKLISKASALVGGRGGGHDVAAGASIPKTKKTLFLLEMDRIMEEEIGK
ncbi:MAG: DHH family phosphoesterase [Nitrososphaerota archaeon]|nr:DHH family phosphoesterase [Nitrososphaerota archaeon]